MLQKLLFKNIKMIKVTIAEEPNLHYQGIFDYLFSPNNINKSSDVTIYCEDGILFSHRLVLASLSDYLGILLGDSNISDKNISLMLPDFSVELVIKYLKWIYNKTGFTEELSQLHNVLKTNADVSKSSEYPVRKLEKLPIFPVSTKNLLLDSEIKSLKKKKSKVNPIWRYCTKLPTSDPKFRRIQCNFCSKILESTDVRSSMRNHLINNHGDQLSAQDSENFDLPNPVKKVDDDYVNGQCDDEGKDENISHDNLQDLIDEMAEEVVQEPELGKNSGDLTLSTNNQARLSLRKGDGRRVRVSPIWKHCTRLESPVANFHKVQCNLCSKILNSSGGSTSSVRSHLVHVHRNELSREDLDAFYVHHGQRSSYVNQSDRHRNKREGSSV